VTLRENSQEKAVYLAKLWVSLVVKPRSLEKVRGASVSGCRKVCLLRPRCKQTYNSWRPPALPSLAGAGVVPWLIEHTKQ